MRIAILTSFFFFIIFFTLLRDGGQAGFYIDLIWAHQLQENQEIFFSREENTDWDLPVISLLDRQRSLVWSFSLAGVPRVRSTMASDQALYHVPLFSDIWYRYTKNQDRVRYTAGHEQIIYWEKDYYGYPFSDAWGERLIVIAGDHSAVDIFDNNGQKLSSFSGIYLTHVCESLVVNNWRSQILLFSEGTFIVLSAQGNRRFLVEKAANETLFLKSCAIAVDGRKLAIHSLVQRDANSADGQLQQQQDEILIYSLDPEEGASLDHRFTLPRIYPHVLFMALYADGILYGSGSENEIFFHSFEDKDYHWQKSTMVQEQRYRPVLALRNYLVYADGPELVMLGVSGIEVLRFPLVTNPLQLLYVPVQSVQESGDDISIFETGSIAVPELFLIRHAKFLQLMQITQNPQR